MSDEPFRFDFTMGGGDDSEQKNRGEKRSWKRNRDRGQNTGMAPDSAERGGDAQSHLVAAVFTVDEDESGWIRRISVYLFGGGWREWVIRAVLMAAGITTLVAAGRCAAVPLPTMPEWSSRHPGISRRPESVQLKPQKSIEWKPIFRGVDLAVVEKERPALWKVFVVRADLTVEGVRPFITPPTLEPDSNYLSMKTSHCLEKYGLAVTVNASPAGSAKNLPPREPIFTLGEFELTWTSVSTPSGRGTIIAEGVPQMVPKLIWEGETLSTDNAVWDGWLVFNRDWRPQIIPGTVPVADFPADCWCGIGGFTWLRLNGQWSAGMRLQDNRETQAAVGCSSDGRFLFFLVVEGRQPMYSHGATYAEIQSLSEIFRIDNILVLDHGGSTTLVMADRAGRAQVVNRPVHLDVPGFERPVANHLGIYAEPLP